jgi:hypothetical protein
MSLREFQSLSVLKGDKDENKNLEYDSACVTDVGALSFT